MGLLFSLLRFAITPFHTTLINSCLEGARNTVLIFGLGIVVLKVFGNRRKKQRTSAARSFENHRCDRRSSPVNITITDMPQYLFIRVTVHAHEIIYRASYLPIICSTAKVSSDQKGLIHAHCGTAAVPHVSFDFQPQPSYLKTMSLCFHDCLTTKH